MKIISLKFRTTGKIHDMPCKDKEIFKTGQKILIQTDQGIEVGTVVAVKKSRKTTFEQIGEILRKVTKEDEEKLKSLHEKAKEALLICQKKAKKLHLPMELLDAELSLDEKKLTFYFMAEERIDFRELVSELVAHFHKNIRLQQIGPRDAAKILGGIGPCGRPLCCQTFLKSMESVTLEMAKGQDLTGMGSSKISGPCGKLMCCLAYEAEIYQKMAKSLPEIGVIIKTKKGKGRVVGRNVLKQAVLVEFEDGTKVEMKNLHQS